MVIATAIFYALLYGAGAVWILLQGRENPLVGDLGDGLAFAISIGLGTAALVVATSRITSRHLGWARALEVEFQAVLGERRFEEVSVLALFSGTAEELFFRGAMQPVLGLFWTSLIFGSVHFLPRRVYYPWTVFAIVVGFLLGGIYEWTDNIYAPVICHVTINGLNLWRICRPGSGTTPSPPEEETPSTDLPPPSSGAGSGPEGPHP